MGGRKSVGEGVGIGGLLRGGFKGVAGVLIAGRR